MGSGSVFRVDVRRKVRSFWSEERLSANRNPRNSSFPYGVPAVCIGESLSECPLPAGPAGRDLQLPANLRILSICPNCPFRRLAVTCSQP